MDTCVRDLDLTEVKPPRGGVVLYHRMGGKVYIILGQDKSTQELTDFGGGIRYNHGETSLSGALREFMEESFGIVTVNLQTIGR